VKTLVFRFSTRRTATAFSVAAASDAIGNRSTGTLQLEPSSCLERAGPGHNKSCYARCQGTSAGSRLSSRNVRIGGICFGLEAQLQPAYWLRAEFNLPISPASNRRTSPTATRSWEK